MACNRSTDVAIAALAGSQGGYISRRQLIGLGLTRSAIQHRLSRGYLIAASLPGVYAVGHIPTHPHNRARGVLLAAGPRAVLSHASAATLWDIRRGWEFPLHVTVRTDRRLRGVVVHRNRLITERDVRTQYGLRVTSPALTILDLAASHDLSDAALQRAIDDLRMPRRFLTLEQLEELAGRFPYHRGTRRLRRLLGIAQPEPTRSGWEQEWPGFAASHGLPPYAMNVVVGGRRVDVLFAAARVAVELDGWEAHRSYAAFVADRDGDADLLAREGIVTVRLTRARVRRQPGREARRLKEILRRRQDGAAA
jgi:hypothetical protein